MNDIVKYFENQEIALIVDDTNTPWFHGPQSARILGYTDEASAIRYHADETDIRTFSGTTLYVNESGIYALVMGSKKPEARRFKHWITSEVLPSIRQTGGYSQPVTMTLNQSLSQTLVLMANVVTKVGDWQDRRDVDEEKARNAPTCHRVLKAAGYSNSFANDKIKTGAIGREYSRIIKERSGMAPEKIETRESVYPLMVIEDTALYLSIARRLYSTALRGLKE